MSASLQDGFALGITLSAHRPSQIPAHHPVESPDKIDHGSPHRAAHIPQFEQVQAARAGFVLADERLRFPEQTGQIDLRKAGTRASLPKQR